MSFFQSVLDFLNRNSGAFTVFFSAVVAGSTVMYVRFTKKLVSETRFLRKAQTEPKVSVTIQSHEESPTIFELVVHNIGQAPAYNITLHITPDIMCIDGKLFSQLSFVQDGIRYLEPGQKWRVIILNITDGFKEFEKTPLAITTRYSDSSEKKYSETFNINLSEMRDLMQRADTPPLHVIAQSLESIKDNINHLSSGFRKLNVIAYTKKDIEGKRRTNSDGKAKTRSRKTQADR